mgnify:CR=1 FL=1
MGKEKEPKGVIRKRVALLVLLVFLVPTVIFGQSYQIPKATFEFYANDFGKFLSSSTIDQINYLGQTVYEDTGETQVVFVSLLGIPEPFEEYTNDLFNKWKIGKNDKGVLFLIAQGEKEMATRIEVGYGHEGDLTDLESDLLLQKFFEIRSEAGTEHAVITIYTEIIRKLTDENYEITPPQYESMPYDSSGNPLLSGVLMIAIVIFIILDMIFFRGAITFFILRMLASGGGGGGRGGGGNRGGSGGSRGGGGRSGGGGASRRG